MLCPLGCAGASPQRFAIDDDAGNLGTVDPIQRGDLNPPSGAEGERDDDASAPPATSAPTRGK
jgi:hypothetical protein